MVHFYYMLFFVKFDHELQEEVKKMELEKPEEPIKIGQSILEEGL